MLPNVMGLQIEIQRSRHRLAGGACVKSYSGAMRKDSPSVEKERK